MAKKVIFDQEAAFKSIIGANLQADQETSTKKKTSKKENERVQRAYYLDKDIDKALKRKSTEEEKTLTEVINEVLRNGLSSYL